MLQLNFLKISRSALSAAFSVFLFTGLAGTASAAEPGDPSRWYKPDITPEERAATSRKEAYAAYKEALDQCAKLAKGERASCIADAKETLQHDLEFAQRRRTSQTASLRLSNEEESPASLVRRHLVMMLDEGACATR